MTINDWMNLKSGTDVRGVAIYGDEPLTLTDEIIEKIVKGFYYWLSQKLNKTELTIAIGHDSRLSAKRISDASISALINCGATVIFTGLSSTPSMFMLLQDEEYSADGSIMITASHLPANKNGLKFFEKNGGLEGKDVTDILHYAFDEKFIKGNGKVINKNFLDKYCKNLVELVKKQTGENLPLKNKKIIVDAGNGAGGFYVDKVLIPLGANTCGSQFLEPDGNFPNHIPNPENKEAMQSICNAVIKNKADFGIIFDTDVDRAGAVDKFGDEINRNKLIALISAILLEEKPNAYIVTDSVTSDGLTEFIKAKGGIHYRFKRGYKNVIDESKRLNGEGKYSPLAIETSGHAALKENYFLDDGAYLITRLLIKLAKMKNGDISNLIKDLRQPKEATEIRLNFTPDVDFKSLGACVIENLKLEAVSNEHLSLAPSNHEGVRINFDKENGNGWALIRMSLHEPIMPINVESDDIGGNKKIIETLYNLLKNYDFLNLTNMKKLI